MALYRRGPVWWMRLSDQGRQIRRSTDVTDKKLAEKIYHKVMVQLAEGHWFPPDAGAEKTVRDLLERYLREHSAPNKAPTTHRCDQSRAQRLIRTFGDLTLKEVRPSLLAAYKATRRAEGAAAKTINHDLTLLGHAFQLAVKEWEWVAENPVHKVSKEKVRNLIERWLTAEEEQRLLAASPGWLQEIIVFAINTGFRQSEILNLQWGQVDLFRRTITLLEQKKRRSRHAACECDDARRAESQGKGPLAHHGLCLLQRGRTPEGRAGLAARVLSSHEESRRDTLSVSRPAPYLCYATRASGRGYLHGAKARPMEDDLNGDALCASSCGKSSCGDRDFGSGAGRN